MLSLDMRPISEAPPEETALIAERADGDLTMVLCRRGRFLKWSTWETIDDVARWSDPWAPDLPILS